MRRMMKLAFIAIAGFACLPVAVQGTADASGTGGQGSENR